MQINEDKIDEVVLALLQLGLHEGCRSWKSYDWDVMARLHAKGLLSFPDESGPVPFIELTRPRAIPQDPEARRTIAPAAQIVRPTNCGNQLAPD